MSSKLENINRALRATNTISFLQGMTAAVLIPRVPDLIHQLNLSFVQWGTLLGFTSLASLLPLVFTNKLILRFGTKRIIGVGGVIFTACTALIPWCYSAWEFALVAILQTLAGSAFNLGLQSSIVMIQKKVKRTVIGNMHAAWSIGATLSAGLSGLLIALLTFKVQFMITAIVITIAMWVASRFLLDAQNDGHLSEQKHVAKISWLKTPGYVWLLTAGLFAGVWSEAVMIDWSALFSKDVLKITSTQAAIAYTAFAGAMIVGRLSIAKITKHIHISQMSMFSSAIGVVGITGGVLLGPILVAQNQVVGLVAVCGFWVLAGLGSAPMVPSFFSAGGNVPGMSTAQVLSRMSFVNTFLIMGGKTVVGAIATGNLQLAVLTPAATLVVAGIISSLVVKRAKANEKQMVEAFPSTGLIPVISQD